MRPVTLGATPTIEGEGFRLRGFRLADFEPIHAYMAHDDITRFLGTLTREAQWEKLLRTHGQWSIDGFGVFVIADPATDEAIGQTGLALFRRDMEPNFGDAPEHAWIVGAGRGRGLATRAAGAALDWFERTHGPTRTVCLIHPDNAPSLRVAEKLGYVPYAQTVYRDAPGVMLERLV